VDGTLRGVPTVPDDTPANIALALRVAASTRSCRFLSDVERTEHGEFAVEALIGPERSPLGGSDEPWYRVRFLIPRDFPYRAAETVPLDPALKWHPHQMGDWDGDHHANILCPPRLHEIHLDELLLPYIRNAYNWIRDARAGRLIQKDQHYEFPHTVNVSKRGGVVYIEGGTDAYNWVSEAGFGRALLSERQGSDERPPILVARELHRHGDTLGSRRMNADLVAHVFGPEQGGGWAPWVFAGDPVVEEPHRPPVRWEDLPVAVQRRVLKATQEVCGYKNTVPILLLAFAIPETWGGSPDRIFWGAIELYGFDPDAFSAPKGFRRSSNVLDWPRVKSFVAANERLRWMKGCVDVSKESILSRAGSEGEAVGNLSIAILGTGAIGSMLAKALASLSPRQIVLVDKEALEPGNLVRHESLRVQVGKPKAKAVADVLSPIHASQSIQGERLDIVEQWSKVAEALAECDVVIDATADAGVNALLSERTELADKSIGWCYVKPGPEFGVLVLRRPRSDLTLLQAEERLMDGLDSDTRRLFEESGSRVDVWPQAGCYSPTFPAPYHRLAMMTGGFVETILSWTLSGETGDVATLYGQDSRDDLLGANSRIVVQITI